jgi:hypothetical protein
MYCSSSSGLTAHPIRIITITPPSNSSRSQVTSRLMALNGAFGAARKRTFPFSLRKPKKTVSPDDRASTTILRPGRIPVDQSKKALYCILQEDRSTKRKKAILTKCIGLQTNGSHCYKISPGTTNLP